MKSIFILLMILFFTIVGHDLGPTASFVQKDGTDGGFVPNSLLVDGVKLAAKKKFDRARPKFEAAKSYWQVHADGALFLKILADVDREAMKSGTASKIFKAVNNDYDTRHKKAVKELSKLVRKNRDYYPLYILQGAALYNLEKPQEAEAAYSKAVELAPDAALPLIHRGGFYTREEEYEAAVADFDEALKRDPADQAVRFGRGFASCLARDYDSAIKDFNAALAGHPDWAKSSIVLEAFYNRGALRLERKSFRGAIRDFDRAIQLDPEYAESYLSRGLAYRGMKKYSKAISEMTIAIHRKPDYTEAYFQRALTHIKRKHYSRAAADMKKVIELQPGNAKFESKLGECYYKQRKYKLAIRRFDKAVKLDANYFWAYYWKGYASKYLGKSRSAVLAFQKFLSLAPGNLRSQRAYAEMEIKGLQRGG